MNDQWKGKIIGGLIGFLIGGPVGAIFGIFVGNMFDNVKIQYKHFESGVAEESFLNAVFLIAGYVAKSDGRVSEQEIAAAKKIMDKLDLDYEHRQMAIELFNSGKNGQFDLNSTLNDLRFYCLFRPKLIHTFIESLYTIARADGENIHPNTENTLNNIFAALGIRFNSNRSSDNYSNQSEYFKNQYYKQQNYHPNQHQDSLDDSCKVLGVATDAAEKDIKLAYRRLINKYHPDKLESKNLPKEEVKKATALAQKIQTAYENIRTIRGFK